MASDIPRVYVLHGEDEFSIAQLVAKLKGKLGDPTIAGMNITQLDGRTLDLNELRMTCMSAPFLADRRLVIIINPLASIVTPTMRKEFISFLEDIPASTALVLIEYRTLTTEKDRQKGKTHWLEKWAHAAGGRAFQRHFGVPRGDVMEDWICNRAIELGGQFSPGAAKSLSGLVGDDTRLVDQEINKLLFYVNFNRPVEPEDVERLTPFEGKLQDFALSNALRVKNAKEALRVVRKQLEADDPLKILGSIVYQFRLMLLARDVLDRGGTVSEAAERLSSMLVKVGPGPAYHAARHAVKFETPALENIYRSLLEADIAIKTGKMSGELTLETLVTQLAA